MSVLSLLRGSSKKLTGRIRWRTLGYSLTEIQKQTEGTTLVGNKIRSYVHAGRHNWRIEERPFNREPDWDDQSRWERFLEVWGFK